MSRRTLRGAGTRTPGFPAPFAWSVASLAVLGLAWFLASRSLPEIILPTIGATLTAVAGLIGDPATFTALGESLSSFALGLLLATGVGGALGILSGLSEAARAAFAPLIAILNAVPSVAWMGLAMIWFGLGAGPTVFLVVVTTSPILAAALQQAVRDRDPRYEELADVFELSPTARLRHLVLPPLLSSGYAALLAMAGLGWKLTVMGEFLTASRGLGEQLVVAKAHMQTDRVIAITVVLVLTWVLVEGALKLIAGVRIPRFPLRPADGRRGAAAAPTAAGPVGAAAQPSELNCHELSLAHGERVIASSLTFTAAAGSVTAILGPSGIGKSTLLHALGEIAYPRTGEIQRTPGARCSWVFQEDRLLPWRTLSENVALFAGVSTQAADAQLAALGLAEATGRSPAELSGGMRQRGALARGFLRESGLLLLDEPFAGLDVRRRRALIEDVKRMRLERARTIVFVTHDVDDALSLADHAIVLGGSPVARITEQLDLRHLGHDRALDDPALAAPRRRLLSALLDSSRDSPASHEPCQQRDPDPDRPAHRGARQHRNNPHNSQPREGVPR